MRRVNVRELRTLWMAVLFVGGAASATIAQTLPAPWTPVDIGAPVLRGAASAASETSFTVDAAGIDIWGTTDQFYFVNQPLSGDGEIVARVTSLTPTDPWAKAGVMFREAFPGT
jgi:hypothetical protein